MNNAWHTLQNPKETESNNISAEATLAPDSLWFDGHFPGFPILPGIAELALVSDMLKEHAKSKGRSVSVSEIRKVRFRQFVKPNDTLEIVSTPDEHEPGVYKFKITVKGQLACNGVMATVPHD
jgi:3-hydroxyacyl-[acyl-carrier-protein] dehydratase